MVKKAAKGKPQHNKLTRSIRFATRGEIDDFKRDIAWLQAAQTAKASANAIIVGFWRHVVTKARKRGEDPKSLIADWDEG